MPFGASIEKEQDATSGSAAIQQALNKKQVPGGDSIDQIMNAKSTNIRLMGRSLKSFLTEIGGMTACNILQFSTAKSRAAMFGGRGLMDSDFTPLYGNMLPSGMQPEDFVRSMGFSIRKGSLLAIEKGEEMPVAFGLRKNKDLSRKGLLRKLGVSDVEIKKNDEELLAEATQQMGIAALGAAAQGKHAKKA
jgi:hypothetical protein